MNEVKIYTKDYCRYCTRAKALLTAKRVTFTEIDVTHNLERQQEMRARSGRRTVPQIFIGERAIGGSDDLVRLSI